MAWCTTASPLNIQDDTKPQNNIYFTLIIACNVVICLLGRVVTAPGGRLNKKEGLTSYGDSHVKDKTS